MACRKRSEILWRSSSSRGQPESAVASNSLKTGPEQRISRSSCANAARVASHRRRAAIYARSRKSALIGLARPMRARGALPGRTGMPVRRNAGTFFAQPPTPQNKCSSGVAPATPRRPACPACPARPRRPWRSACPRAHSGPPQSRGRRRRRLPCPCRPIQ